MQTRKSLVWKIIVPVLLVMALVVVSVLYYLPKTITELAVEEAKVKAEETVDRFKHLRGYYTENVVSKVLEHSNLAVTMDHKSGNGAIPLPATMIHDLSEQFSQRGTTLKLYSLYPFPNRANRQLDDFAKQAWRYLTENPESEYIKILNNDDGSSVVRVAIADALVSEACVQCHNSHPFSPKVDWKLGDVRGILEVDSVIEPAIRSGELLGMKLALFICAVISLLVMLIYIIHRYVFQIPLHKLALLLEGSNNKNNEELVTLISGYPIIYPENHEHNEISFLYHKFLQQRERLEENARSVRKYQEQLEAEIELNAQLLEERSAQLSETRHQLVATQKELLQTDKLSALKRLVISIGHEVSTPLGVSKVASSVLIDDTAEILTSFQNDTMTRTQFERFLIDNKEAGELIATNLTRTHELMMAFKEVAVDQISEQLRSINLHDYIQDVLLSLKPTYKNSPVEVINQVQINIELEVEPGAIAQIVTNLITNSLMHGFKDGSVPGSITFSSETTPDEIVLIYTDDGVGMSEEVKAQVFEQFFTTRKGSGGTGIGMYVICELVQDRLNGSIELISSQGKGVCIRIAIPR